MLCLQATLMLAAPRTVDIHAVGIIGALPDEDIASTAAKYPQQMDAA